MIYIDRYNYVAIDNSFWVMNNIPCVTWTNCSFSPIIRIIYIFLTFIADKYHKYLLQVYNLHFHFKISPIILHIISTIFDYNSLRGTCGVKQYI